MRTIKFRAWSELDKKIYQCDMEEDIQDYFKHDDGITLMQYTGLKDKNGKEIYEGDIILVNSSGYSELKGKTISVEWKYCGFVDGYYHWELREKPIDYEVIGNIYENPELLERR